MTPKIIHFCFHNNKNILNTDLISIFSVTNFTELMNFHKFVSSFVHHSSEKINVIIRLNNNMLFHQI